MAEKQTTIAISDYFEQLIRELIASGRYGNKSEVVRAGLRLLEQQERGEWAEFQAVGAAMDPDKTLPRGEPSKKHQAAITAAIRSHRNRRRAKKAA
jgi:putative addiction module CopG family antidote